MRDQATGRGASLDFSVFIGRMRPVTQAHVASVRHALSMSRTCVTVVGSAEQAPSPRTPFSEMEVEHMLRGALTPDENARLLVRGVRDMYNNQLWISEVRRAVRDAISTVWRSEGRPEIGLVGHHKDERTSDYLNRFKGWEAMEVPYVPDTSATPIRNGFWKDPGSAIEEFGNRIPPNVAQFLQEFSSRPLFTWLQGESRAYENYLASAGSLRHPPMYVEAMPVVVLDGYVLLVERDSRPGLGLLSLPEVFVQEREEIKDAIMRGLFSRTRLKVPRRTVEARMSRPEVFSYPWRNERGRILAMASLIELVEEEFPKVSPGAGAARVEFHDYATLERRRVYGDHARVMDVVLGRSRSQ